MNPAVRAAVEVARRFGVDSHEAELIHETNHTVVWLRPNDVIAKVGTRRDAEENLTREFEVASQLFAQGAPVVRPFPDAVPARHCETEYFVTLWQRLERTASGDAQQVEVGDSLRRVHAGLEKCAIAMPSFRVAVSRARVALRDDRVMSAMPASDRAFLRRAFDETLARLETREFRERPLHGEPHADNQLSTASGTRWLDFENVCVGPLEWDLAFLGAEARAAFPGFDADLLQVLRSLISACVATWCGMRARFPEMRLRGEEHLSQLRATMGYLA